MPHKLHHFGNEYHSICCGISGLIWGIEMAEGKDLPKDRTEFKFKDQEQTTGLLLRLTKAIHGQSMAIVLDSGFCVLKALIVLMKVGVYASALIKK